MATTAKVRCTDRTDSNGQSTYTFTADYLSDDGKAINAEWAQYTPELHLVITVKPEVEFDVHGSYTLTFEPVEA